MLFLCLLLASCRLCSTRPRHFVDECGEKTIAILDIANSYPSGDIPLCDVTQNIRVRHRILPLVCCLHLLGVPESLLQVAPVDGIVYRSPGDSNPLAHATYGTHAAPWYLAEAIRASGHYTADIDSADLVYVDDYCLYLQWLAHVHSFGVQQPSTFGSALYIAYSNMVASPRWQSKNGADFVFYDSHPGFRSGWAADNIMHLICDTFANSTMLVVDRPMRSVCDTYRFSAMPKVLVTPYNPNSLGRSHLSQVELRPAREPHERNGLIYSKATCHETVNAGKAMRWYITEKVLKNATLEGLQVSGIDVSCTNAEYGGKYDTFESVFECMSTSRFCLALPGDSASTRRLSEIMLAACIPVFVGPPYHSMPFHHTIDWAAAGVFFNISDYKSWLGEEFQWSLSTTQNVLTPNDAQWWSPDADIYSSLINIDDASEVRPVLTLSVHACLRVQTLYRHNCYNPVCSDD